MERHTGTFTAKSSDGSRYTIEIWRDSFDPSTPDDSADEVEGIAHMKTPDGQIVTKTGRRQYRLFGSDLVLTSDDPQAP